jgi:hypothetical protein
MFKFRRSKKVLFKSLRWAMLIQQGYVTMHICPRTQMATMEILVQPAPGAWA